LASGNGNEKPPTGIVRRGRRKAKMDWERASWCQGESPSGRRRDIYLRGGRRLGRCSRCCERRRQGQQLAVPARGLKSSCDLNYPGQSVAPASNWPSAASTRICSRRCDGELG